MGFSNNQMVEEGDSRLLSKILLSLIFLVLFIILLYSSYLLYIHIPREPVNLNIDVAEIISSNITEKGITGTEAKQFYPNMKFNHNNISYFFHNSCDDRKKERLKKAFNEITRNVNLLSFVEVDKNPDIFVSCEKNSEENIQQEYFIAGEGGAREIIPTGRFNIINEGVIFLYDNPNKEIHELMHVFGFDHNNDKKSIMYPLLDSCDQQLDDSIVEELKKIYLIEDIPDLYFEDINAVKKGIYLDFKLTIKNSGSVPAENIKVVVLDEGEVIEVFNLDRVDYGGGILIETNNLKLKRLKPDNLEFVIDKENKIKEIDEKNNAAIINL